VKTMQAIYNKVDADRSGEIDVVELLTLLDIDRTAFTERIFSAFDKDHTGRIDFYEFVVSLWKFCTLGDGSLNVFTFDLYDSDADGKLSNDQVHKMFRELFGAKAMDSEVVKAGMAELLKEATKDSLSIEVFIPYCKYHQALLAPVFTIQDKLRRATLSGLTWESISMRKIEVHAGKTLPIRELMVLHSNRNQFRALLTDQTVLRVSSMMRIVLDNTDNAPRPTTPPGSPNTGKQRNAYLIDPNARRGSRDSAPRRGSGDSREPRSSTHSHESKDIIPRGSMDSRDASRDSNDGHDSRGISLPVSRDHTELREGRDRRDKERGVSRMSAKTSNRLPKSLLHN